ncbi:MAG TPA: hypothetical protein VHB77_11865 [Planctomycetaceae bacterium]|nr:hypothetical protein [Planctomycetaceae bacterium]
MNCIEFEQLLERQIEEREPLDSSAPPSHVTACPACRGLWDRQILLEEALAAWKVEPLAADLTDRILGHVRASTVVVPAAPDAVPTVAAETHSAPAAVWSLDRARIALCGLAALFVAAVLWSDRFESAPGKSGPTVAEMAQPRDIDPEMPQIDVLMASAQTAYRELAHGTAEMAQLPVIPSTPVELPPTGAPIPQPLTWFGGVGHELAPLQTEVGSALNFLWDTLPGDDPST